MTALSALPAIPSGGCPSAAAAIGAAGLGPVCQATSGVSGLAGSAASHLAGAGVDGVLNGLGSWVADGATWLLEQIGAVIAATTTVDLGALWFSAHYQTMAALAAVVVVPLLLLGVMQAIYRQDVTMLLRSVLVHVPLALLLTAVAVKLVQLGLVLTDSMSAAVAQGAGLDSGHFMGSVTNALSGAQDAGSPGAPAFVLFLAALAVVVGAVMVWIELLLRAAAVYVAVLFLPLALASLAWPAIAHWCRRLVDTLVALVLGKFVIVAVLSLAAGALAGGTGSNRAGTGIGSSVGTGSSGGFGAVLGGAALLLLAALSPWALLRLLPFVEAGAVGHLEGIGRRAQQVATTPARGLAQVAMRAAVAGGGAGALVGGAALAGGASTIAGRASRSGPGAGFGAGVGASRGGTVSARAGVSDGRPGSDPSSAETTGVGTTHPPGHSIPHWEPNPRATALARYYLEGTDPVESPPSDPSGAAGSPRAEATEGPNDLVRLPLATAARAPAWLGRDELGARLVANRPGFGPAASAGSTPSGDADG